MKLSFKDQTVIVTGGSSGIGKAIAEKFAKLGAKVAIFGSNSDKGKKARQEISNLSGSDTIKFYQVDVSKTLDVEKAILLVIEDFGVVDVLVNNAGITRDNLLMKMKEEDWDRVLNVNLKSIYNTCKPIVRHMMKAKRGKIVNISSVIGLTGNAGQMNYAASKSGIIGVTKSLAKELASRKICVNCIAPGFIETQMTEGLSDKLSEAILNQIPLKRMGLPLEIANAAIFLASEHANYITGHVLTVDGGMTM